MSDLSGLATGLAQGLTGYLQGNIQQKRQQENAQFQTGLQTQQAETLESYKQGLEGTMTPDMGSQLFSQVSPEFGQAAFKALTDFKQSKGRDMTIKEAGEALDPVMKGLMM